MLEIAKPSFKPEVLYVADGYFREGTKANPHYHDSIEISIVLKGPTFYHINHQSYLVETGDVVIINPYDLHFEEQKTGTSHHMHLGLDSFQLLGYEKNQIPIISPVIKMGQSEVFHHIIKRVLKEKEESQLYQEAVMRLLATDLLILLLREIDKQKLPIKPVKQKEKSKTVLANSIKYYLEAHHSEDISLDSLSSSMYISPTYMSKLFKQETGESPINYLIKIRMEKAKELLVKEELSVKEIANSVGYQDAYHFSKLFKKYTGNSPSDYIKKKTSTS